MWRYGKEGRDLLQYRGGGLPGERDGDAHWKIRIRPKGDQSGHGSGFI